MCSTCEAHAVQESCCEGRARRRGVGTFFGSFSGTGVGSFSVWHAAGVSVNKIENIDRIYEGIAEQLEGSCLIHWRREGCGHPLHMFSVLIRGRNLHNCAQILVNKRGARKLLWLLIPC